MAERFFGGPREGQGDFGRVQQHLKEQSRVEGQTEIALKGGEILRAIENALGGSGLDKEQKESLRTALLDAYYAWEAREEKGDSADAQHSIH